MLDEIVAAHRRAVADDTRWLDDLLVEARQVPPPRPFREALSETDSLTVIAEIKRRSPSAGDLNPGLTVSSMAVEYEEGGASALSVLTDHDFFGGSPDDLGEARTATALPVLRKDFTVSEIDIADARIMGADAVLLIVGILDDLDGELERYFTLASELGMDALVEVHDEDELERALAAGAHLVGVNSRDLNTFEVDLAVAERLAPEIPDGVVKVAESGIQGPGDARRLADAGYDAVLVGTSLVTSGDPRAAIRALKAHRPDPARR